MDLVSIYFLLLQKLLLVDSEFVMCFTLLRESLQKKYKTIFTGTNIAQQELNVIVYLFGVELAAPCYRFEHLNYNY